MRILLGIFTQGLAATDFSESLYETLVRGLGQMNDMGPSFDESLLYKDWF